MTGRRQLLQSRDALERFPLDSGLSRHHFRLCLDHVDPEGVERQQIGQQHDDGAVAPNPERDAQVLKLTGLSVASPMASEGSELLGAEN